MPVIIDTNVWLDLLVFDDSAALGLAQQLAGGLARALATAAMRAELADVLSRPKFSLSANRIDQALARYDGWIEARPDAPDCRLPCRDPDDRKFLDLAVLVAIGRPGAWLISKDKALLAARKPADRRFGLRIGTLEQFNRIALPAITP